MGNNLISKGYIARRDNTSVNGPNLLKYNLTPQQKQKFKVQSIQNRLKKKQGTIVDANKVRFYKNMQDSYNNNFFGYGVFGKQTRFDPSTQQGQQAIQSNFNYAKSNAQNFIENVALSGVSGQVNKLINKGSKIIKGPFKSATHTENLGAMKQYTRNGTIGSGSEAVVVNNTPTTVGKITNIPKEEMAARNSIPNTVESRYIGYVKNRGQRLPTYIQRKVKVLTDKTFPKYISRLDKSMSKSGFRRVNDSNVQYRAYTNGSVVIDDISPGNVGLNIFRNPKIIDMNYQTVPQWISQGFTLKLGGKLIGTYINRH